MADQRFDSHHGLFWLNLHGCKTSEAQHALTLRLNECHAYGIDKIVVVHGTPQQIVGSLAEAVVEIAEAHPRVSDDYVSFGRLNAQLLRTAATKITVASNSAPLPQNEAMIFAPISSSYETKTDRISRCTNNFQPLSIWYPLSRLQVHFGSTIPPEVMQDCLRDIADKDRRSDESGQISVNSSMCYRMLAQLTRMLQPTRIHAQPSRQPVAKVSSKITTHLLSHVSLARWARRMSSAFAEFAEGDFRRALRPLDAALGCLESDKGFLRRLTLLNLAVTHYRLGDLEEALGQLRQIPSDNIDPQLSAFILECEANVYESQARYADAANSLSAIDPLHLTIQMRERLLLLKALTGEDSVNLEMIEGSGTWEAPFSTTHLLLEISQNNEIHTETKFRLLKSALTRLERLLGRFDTALVPVLTALCDMATSLGHHESNTRYLERVSSINAQNKWLDAKVPILQMIGQVLDDFSLTLGIGDSEVLPTRRMKRL